MSLDPNRSSAPDPRDLATFVTMMIQVARGRLGVLDVPLFVLKLANGSHECVSPQHARGDRDEVAFALVRQALYLVGAERFDAMQLRELLERAEADDEAPT